ncbi:hypothetical protein NB466_08000 [Vibrio fluvialis]|uniref:hypothetical protein n=1 Tax=Vibrio fluvialis TaxID=676 RepID=UPI00215CCF3D|nr:hypothetical protein [Vibrio fluvialis]MCR9298831.1 hypothetical protein [Vibrio fluvialis]
MNSSKRCEMYCAILLENNQAELALVSEEHVKEIAYMMAGAICYAEHQYSFYVSDSDISSVASEASNMLINRPDRNPTYKQMPLVLTAIQRYREFAIPQLGGQQTLCISDASTPPPQHINSIEITNNRPLANLLATANRCDSRILILLVLAAIALGGMFL